MAYKRTSPNFIEGGVTWFNPYSIMKYFETLQEHSEWEDKLTSERKDSIRYYTGEEYEFLNENLRNNAPLSEAQSKNVKHLDALIEDYELPEPIIVYRGLPPHVMDSYLAKRKQNKKEPFSDKAYSSCSCYSKTGIVNKEGDDLLVILVPSGKGNGAYIGFQSLYPKQYEFLIRKDNKMEYKNHAIINGRRVFYFELINKK